MSPRTGRAADLVVTNAGELLTCPVGGGLGIVRDGAVAVAGGRVVWVGRAADLAVCVPTGPETRVLDAGGRVVMPGLVECHTHLAFGGDRADEFQMRVAGRSYENIAASGGGIVSTVRATRAASTEELLERGRGHLDALLAFGVTTVEAKSGYGLTLDDELRLLRVYRELDATHPVTVVPTFMGAHTVPAEYRSDSEGYVDLVVERMLPAVAAEGLARFCDVFCERGAFTPEESRRVLTAAVSLGLRPKVHADQLAWTGGAELAAELGAVSAEHLDYVSPEGIEAIAAVGVTAVLLPGAVVFLGLSRFAPATRLLEAGVHVALSTDFNPGTCYSENLWLMGSIASSYMKMQATDVIRAMTVEAARALAMEADVGTLEPGNRGDLLVLDAQRHQAIPYHLGANPVLAVVKDGRVVVEKLLGNPISR